MITKKEEKMISKFINYMEYDEIGDWKGLNEDATETAKLAYEEYMAEEEKARGKGVFI